MAPLLIAGFAVAAVPAASADRWEIRGDNGSFTNNELQPGIVQEGHDLEATGAGPDEDWYTVRCREIRSYEARVFGGGVVWKYPACPECADFDRVAPDGTVLTAGDWETTLGPSARSVRWICGVGVTQQLRVRPNRGVAGYPSEKYDILVVDTTLFLPRFNNVGTQRTVLILQNALHRPVDGEITFQDGAGTRLHTRPFAISGYASLVLDTASVPALQGRSGSAIVAHTGGQAALVGKGVMLEPSSGFSFDTPLSGVPR
jgi:hypothetical protein